MNVLVALFDLDEEIPEETRIRILKPLRAAEAKAAQKAAKAKESTEGLDPTDNRSDETD